MPPKGKFFFTGLLVIALPIAALHLYEIGKGNGPRGEGLF